MKTVQTLSLQLPNGDILLGVAGKDENRIFYVKNEYGIFTYDENEIDEIYGLVPADTDLIGTIPE